MQNQENKLIKTLLLIKLINDVLTNPNSNEEKSVNPNDLLSTDFTVSYLVSVIDMINNNDLDFINGEEGDSCGCGPNCERCEEDASDYDEELYEALRGA